MGSKAPASGIFDGWQAYPQNLSLSVLATDAPKLNTRLSEDAGRLFLPPDEDGEIPIRGTIFGKGLCLYIFT